MTTNAPKKITVFIATIIGLVAIFSNFVSLPFISEYSFWLLSLAWALLAFACFAKKL